MANENIARLGAILIDDWTLSEICTTYLGKWIRYKPICLGASNQKVNHFTHLLGPSIAVYL